MAHKRRTPRRGAHGRFVKSNPVRHRRRRVSASPVRRRRSVRRNVYMANPRRRRASHPMRRRHYRRNPPMFGGGGIMGIKLTDIMYAGVGFIAPPAINGFLSTMLPAALTGNMAGRYAIKAGTVFGLSWAGKRFISPEAGKMIAIGGITYIVANLIIDFVPSLFAGFSGYMNPGQTFRPHAVPGMKSGPYLGMYQMYQGIGTTPAKLPERIDPNARF
jgi:hypothetical protein